MYRRRAPLVLFALVTLAACSQVESGTPAGESGAPPEVVAAARDWPLPSAGVDKHRGYAFQWYALAATAFLFFLVTGFRRASRSSNNTR